MKRVFGALYGIFLEPTLDKILYWKLNFEKERLGYCKNGCGKCYRWKCPVRSKKQGTPYKKFRRADLYRHGDY